MAFLTDGHPTRISLASGSLSICEKEVTPPDIDAGGPNDTTTMCNTAYRTMAPKKLLTLGQMEFTAAYDPVIYSEVLGMVGVNQIITVTFPDGSTLEFYGWVDKFKPGSIKEGEMPTATVTIQASNQDNSGVETPPVYTP